MAKKYRCPACKFVHFIVYNMLLSREELRWHAVNKRWEYFSENFRQKLICVERVECMTCHYELEPAEITKFSESLKYIKKSKKGKALER